jgi:ABC-type nitrate/sulfonate/bicarbonate transport system substrate-binding protein
VNRSRFARSAAAAALVVGGGGRANAQESVLDTVRVALNFSTYTYLPIFLAVDKGYFIEQRLNVVVSPYQGSSTFNVPRLARGDLDLSPMVLSPGFFNQGGQGFDVQLIAALTEAHHGWNDTTWIVVRQDLWDSNAVRTLADLRGKRLDGVAAGSLVDYLMRLALAKARIPLSAVTYTNKINDNASIYAALRNHAVDVLGNTEVIVTQLEQQKLAHRWLTTNDIAPGVQESFLAASAPFLKNHRDAAKRFLMGYLRAAHEIEATGGTWTPELVRTVAKWSQLSEEVIRSVPGPAYNSLGLKPDSVERQQKFWVDAGLVQTPAAIATLVDGTILADARRALGLR